MKKIHPSPMDIKKVDSESSSIPVTNIKGILTWMVEVDQIKAFKSDHKSLTQSFVEEMNRDFGDPDSELKGEYHLYKWTLEYKGNIYNIFTGEGKGTSIEICDKKYSELMENKKEYLNVVKDFLMSLSIRLNTVNIY